MDFNIREEKKFRYVEEGEGPVLILLHGLFGALSNWKDVLEEFSKKYKVVVPLMPIYDLPVLFTSVGYLARHINRFVKYKKYENYILIGNSLGGHVALVQTVKNPENIAGLVLTGSSGLYEDATMGGTYPKRGDKNFIKEKVEFTFYDPASATPELVEEVFEIVNNRLKALKILTLAKSAIRHNMSKEIGKIRIPTCIVWGMNDKITPPNVAEEFHKLIPGSDLFWIDKCGHAPMMERPDEFNKVVDEWLNRKFSALGMKL
jgi:pimeloyl-ACP methyl ester carboxylesterase